MAVLLVILICLILLVIAGNIFATLAQGVALIVILGYKLLAGVVNLIRSMVQAWNS